MPLELDDAQRRRLDRSDRWLFIGVWLAIGVMAVIAVLFGRS